MVFIVGNPWLYFHRHAVVDNKAKKGWKNKDSPTGRSMFIMKGHLVRTSWITILPGMMGVKAQ